MNEGLFVYLNLDTEKPYENEAFIRTDKIDYVTGKEFCRENRSVKRHIGMSLEV